MAKDYQQEVLQIAKRDGEFKLPSSPRAKLTKAAQRAIKAGLLKKKGSEPNTYEITKSGESKL